MVAFFALIAVALLVIILAIPLTWLTMLFLGNLGLHLGFLAILPGVIAAKALFSYNVSLKK